MPMDDLTAERLRELLQYDPETGLFTWRADAYGGFRRSVLIRAAGSTAGCRRADGRSLIRVDGRLYLAYRLAWLYVNGCWPAEHVDHIDGNPSNDAIANLRAVDERTNQQNKRIANRSKQSCRLMGVFSNKRNKTSPWRACISVDGKFKQLGVFKTQEEAHAAYLDAKRKHHQGFVMPEDELKEIKARYARMAKELKHV